MNFVILTDYLGRFGSKQKSTIYRGGLDLKQVINLLTAEGHQVKCYSFSEWNTLMKEQVPHVIIYTSSEDFGDKYKSFIEDIICSLQFSNHICLPNFHFLKAHNNKVYMEMLRNVFHFQDTEIFNSQFAATIQELEHLNIEFPIVVKGHAGALSKSVFKAKTRKELSNIFKKIAAKLPISKRVRERLRRFKHRNNYSGESIVFGKVVLQQYIENITHDWKVLVYFDKLFVLKRQNRKNDFRASGSGLFSYTEQVPKQILDFALACRKKLGVPHVSLDIALLNDQPILFEFQAIYFGTKTLENSTYHFTRVNTNWELTSGSVELERIYVYSILQFLNSDESTLHQ